MPYKWYNYSGNTGLCFLMYVLISPKGRLLPTVHKMNGDPFEIEEKASALLDEEISQALNKLKEEIEQEKRAKKAAPSGSKGHRGRVKERFLASGFDGFAEHEVLELLLFYAIPYKDTKQTAYELLKKFGNIAGVFNASVSDLTQISGITENAAILFKMIPPLIGIYYTENQQGMMYTNTSELAAMFRPYFVGAGSNLFMMACFDRNLRMIGVSRISDERGGASSIIMRSVMTEALKGGCRMAAIAHNHPGASPKPSEEDIAVTRRIGDLLNAIDVKLMDHIIIGSSKTYSMRDGGELGIFD